VAEPTPTTDALAIIDGDPVLRAVADLTTTAEGIERESVRAVAAVTARAEAAEARAASLESALRSARCWRAVGWGLALALAAWAVWR
jgi:hypothetical protein